MHMLLLVANSHAFRLRTHYFIRLLGSGAGLRLRVILHTSARACPPGSIRSFSSVKSASQSPTAQRRLPLRGPSRATSCAASRKVKAGLHPKKAR